MIRKVLKWLDRLVFGKYYKLVFTCRTHVNTYATVTMIVQGDVSQECLYALQQSVKREYDFSYVALPSVTELN